MSFLVIGVDPGVGRTGVVVMNEHKEVLAGATFMSKLSQFCHGARIYDLAHEVRLWLDDVVPPSMWDLPVRFAIETPVMNKVRNVKTFSLQWRLVQELLVTPIVGTDVTAIEVHNTAVKVAATGKGNASKDEVVDASPFYHEMFGVTDTAHASVEALADAWAIALCAFDPPKAHISFKPTEPSRQLACTKGPIHEV
jgi:Holliday junction resolvasome RuvABC endonuclease subunit